MSTSKSNLPSTTPRKLVYLGIIMAIFVVMFPYNQWLQRKKTEEYKLDNAALGKIDADSFMLKVAQLCGARGVAANVLWMKSIDLKKRHEWDEMAATVDRITTLQPHFLTVWSYQGWNLAYNVSVEWDAPEDKYAWIKKGIQFIQRGVDKNRTSPDLLWDTAWTYYHKLGYSDEAVILRGLFRDDPEEEFHSVAFKDLSTDDNDPERRTYDDNFPVARGWFYRAVSLVEDGQNRLFNITNDDQPLEFVDPTEQRKGRPGDVIFFTHPAQAQSKYASSLQKTSMVGRRALFGDRARLEWGNALEDWEWLGQHVFTTPNEVRDEDGEILDQDVRIIDSIVSEPEYADRYQALNDNQQYWTRRYADQINYPYWYDRCRIERTEDGVDARRYFYTASIAFLLGEFEKAVSDYEVGLQLWSKLMDEYPSYAESDQGRVDNGLLTKRYIRAFKQANGPDAEVAEDTPFLEDANSMNEDINLDPFDAIDMGLVDRETLRRTLEAYEGN